VFGRRCGWATFADGDCQGGMMAAGGLSGETVKLVILS
jgi:hypothetical protein